MICFKDTFYSNDEIIDRLHANADEIERLQAEIEYYKAENMRLIDNFSAVMKDAAAAARSMRERIKANLHWLSPEAHQMYIDVLPLIEEPKP